MSILSGFWFAFLVGGIAIAEETPATRPGDRLAPAAPTVIAVDQAFLVEAARRAIRSQLGDGKPSDTSYIPPALRDLRCPAFVTLRDEGTLAAVGQSESAPVVTAVVAAAGDALRGAATKKKPLTAERAARCSIEIELIGPSERVGTAAELPEELAARYEPGIDGISAHVGAKDVFIRPSQLLSLEPTCVAEDEPGVRCNRYRIAIESLLTGIGVATSAPAGSDVEAALPAGGVAARSVVLSRYRTLHFWQRRGGERPVELISGMRLVAPSEVTPERLDEVIRRTARYILYRQMPDGFFSYEYLPGRDRYNDEDQSWVRQAGVVWATAVYARLTGDEAARRASDRAIDAMRAMVRPMAGVPHAAFVATPDEEHKLGTTALSGLALLDAPEPERYAETVSELGAGVRALQTENGRFLVNFPPAPDQSASQDYSPGEGLLLLARLYDRTRDSRWRETIDRAMPYYRTYYREAAGPPFVIWQMQAFGQLARTTTLTRYAEFVFEMADKVVSEQLHTGAGTPGAGPLTLYDGGLDVYGKGRTGISTAPYLEGLNEALRTARAFGDKDRAERYATAIRGAARFVMQLQFKPEEAFYVRSLTDTVDGFRSNPVESGIRIDNDQHAMLALMGARQLLWPDAPVTWSVSTRPNR